MRVAIPVSPFPVPRWLAGKTSVVTAKSTLCIIYDFPVNNQREERGCFWSTDVTENRVPAVPSK